MKNRIFLYILTVAVVLTVFSFSSANIYAASVTISTDKQWIEGLSTEYEYITQNSYDTLAAHDAYNPNWSSLSLSGGKRADGSTYLIGRLTEGHKLQVYSAWYGQDVYFRKRGSSGKGTVISVPAFSEGAPPYKTAIKVINAYSADTGDSFYAHYIESITDTNGYLIGTSENINIEVTKFTMPVFNKQPKNILTDAEGNYIYDLIAVGVYTNSEPDISGAAAWALQDYIAEGYGFLIGHDTMYGYGGVSNSAYVPNKNSTDTPIYVNNSKTNGHWNLNWLMGVNKLYTEASPYEAASMILNIGDYRDKSTLYGDYSGRSQLRIKATNNGNPLTNISARCPTNFPYTTKGDGVPFNVGETFWGGATHSNQQLAYGKVWIDFASNSIPAIGCGKLLLDTNSGLGGTNNFYLTTNGNFGMMQIGHERANLIGTSPEETRILANTIMYLSQRQQCQVCQSKQNGHSKVHFARRISSAEELAKIGNPAFWFTHPINGCYVLSADLVLPEAWQPIKDFTGHFNADGHNISILNGKAVFEQVGSKWNLGADNAKGTPSISYLNNKTTGVARIVGNLSDLFQLHETDFSEYKIIVTDGVGKNYIAYANNEGKYVLSNLPCTGEKSESGEKKNKLTARVFDRSGAEVTAYGEISAFIPVELWNTDETVQLQLKSLIEPIDDKTVYEEQQAEYNSIFNADAQLVEWEFKPSEAVGWVNVLYSGLDYTIEPMTKKDGKTYSSLTVNNALLEQNDWYFRAVYTYGGKKYNTFDAKTANKSGRLIVLERPLEIIHPSNETKWKGDEMSLTATGLYYRSFDIGLAVEWQYRGDATCVWESVDGGLVKDTYVKNGVKPTGDTLKPYANTSTLIIPLASTDYEGYEFRAVFKMNAKNKAWESNVAKAHVKFSQIICNKSPVSVKITLNDDGTVPDAATAEYKAEFTFKSKDGIVPTLNWSARVGTKGEFKNIPSSIISDVKNSAAKPTGKEDEYIISSTLYIKNPSVEMDSDATHYFFRAHAALEEVNAYSDPADLSINYGIDIIAGEPDVTPHDGDGYDFTFSRLRIFAPIGLRVVRVEFQNGAQDLRNSIILPSLPADVSTRQEGDFILFESSDTKSAEVWQDFLREIVFSVFSDEEKIYWYVDELENELIYDPETGKFSKHEYEYVNSPNITWTQSHASAQAKHNAKLNTYGHLATITTEAENEKVKLISGGNNTWLGATKDSMYNGGSADLKWIDTKPLVYSKLRADAPAANGYMYMLADGTWSLAPNVNNVTVYPTDQINWWNSWGVWGTSGIKHFHAGENIFGDVWTGLAIRHAYSNYSIAGASVYLEYGHTYWFSTLFGESGDSNTSVEFYFTAFGYSGYSDFSTYWAPTNNSQKRVEGVSTFYGATGAYNLSYKTYSCAGVSPSAEPVGYGQVFYCDLVDLTASFGSNIDKASLAWCQTNLRGLDGTRSFTFTSSTSTMQGYLVEYELNDIGFGRSNHSADCVSTIIKPKEWETGREGIRISVVDADTGLLYRPAFDISANANDDVTKHFSYKNKIQYRDGAQLEPSSEPYESILKKIPTVIKPGTTNFSELKEYFNKKESLELIAAKVGLTKEQLVSGRYKIVLEPIAYLPINGGLYAFTATEAAMYNAGHNDILRQIHKKITHQALPFALYLEEPDLGFKSWTSSIDKVVSDNTIIQNLGVYIIRFGAATQPPNTTQMRVDTDVYLSCDVFTDDATKTNPDNPGTVQFTVNGETFTHSNIYMPEAAAQRAYVKWHTPQVPGKYEVIISSSANVKTDISSFIVDVVQLIEQTPPDPKATDVNKSYMRPLSLPFRKSSLACSWLEYSCKKQNDKWEYTPVFHNARLGLSVKTQPDTRVPTAKKENVLWQMKSGYGFNVNALSSLRSSSANIIKAQTGIAYFPEFLYATYNRILHGENGAFSFAPNKYSQWNNPVHFTPLWFPDGAYTPLIDISDAWTPAGELMISGSDTITIKDSVFDDWYVAKGN